jgi:hypothetical protein
MKTPSRFGAFSPRVEILSMGNPLGTPHRDQNDPMKLT